MDNERLQYVEGDIRRERSADDHMKRSICSLVFGALSIALSGLLGVILGVLARKLSGQVLADGLTDTVTAKLARAGQVTGTVGGILSVVSLFLLAVIAFGAALILVLLLIQRLSAL